MPCCNLSRMILTLLGALAFVAAIPALRADAPDVADPRVLGIQAQRIAAIEKVSPTVVAIFSPGGQGGGSGVVISKDGYALTNFHVVQGSGPVMKCGRDFPSSSAAARLARFQSQIPKRKLNQIRCPRPLGT